MEKFEWTDEARKKVQEIKNDPKLQDDIKGLTDEEILAKWRFNDGDGTGVTAYDNEMDALAAIRKWREQEARAKNTDTIEEV